ncbi:hypothetical protein GCM10028796_07360 [Ramlibacter monticola]|uniref:Uncharacterized protein n=1 Tax=Ramlibacter monticola TaxID=1926872 RepID=A0A937CS13_9BURK|nr:hypothetical protein [Ramlibacter monticola]MBL0389597.1 hypothetical protein [Ramlibacter monticola]
MTMQQDGYRVGRFASNLEDIDREVARLAQLCRVPLLQRGVVERVLHGDDSVCGTKNSRAFVKLHDLLMLHFAVREKSADQLGQRQTAAIEMVVVERLRKSFPDLAADWPPA